MTSRTRFTLALATMILAASTATTQPGPFGGKGKGPGGKGQGPNPAQKALDRLDLSGKALDKAQDVLDAHNRVTRKMLDRARLDLLNQMKETVSEEQYLLFKDAVNSPPGQRGVSSNDLIERVMAFDKNQLGMVCKDDLPERMQHLVDKGDLNKDGYLDRDEAKLMALKLGQPTRGPGRAFTPADVDRALTRLALTGEPRNKAQKSLDVFKEAARKVNDERRADLIERMKTVLSDDQHKRFRESLQASASKAG